MGGIELLHQSVQLTGMERRGDMQRVAILRSAAAQQEGKQQRRQQRPLFSHGVPPYPSFRSFHCDHRLCVRVIGQLAAAVQAIRPIVGVGHGQTMAAADPANV